MLNLVAPKNEKELSFYENLHWARKYTFWNARWNPENECCLFLLRDFLNNQGRNSVGSFLTCQFYPFYLPLEWNCLSLGGLISASPDAPFSGINHFSVYQHRSKDEDMLTFTIPTLAVQNRLREFNICAARALEEGLYINEMQVLKLQPRGDLNSADTFQPPPMCILKHGLNSQHLVPARTGLSANPGAHCLRRQLFQDPSQELEVTLTQRQILKAKGSLSQLNGWKSLLETRTSGNLRHFSLLKKKWSLWNIFWDTQS